MPPHSRRSPLDEYDAEAVGALPFAAPSTRTPSGIPEDVAAYVMRGTSEGVATKRDPLADAQERGALLDFMARQGAALDNVGRELVGLGRREAASVRGQPVAELQQRQAAADKAAMRDPESPRAARLRALLGETGADLSPETLAQLTAEDGDDAFQVAGMRLSGKAREDAAVAAERKRVADLAEKKRQEAFAEERRKDDWRRRDANADLNRRTQKEAAAITAGDKATQQQLENEAKLRAELAGNPTLKAYHDTAASFDKMQRAAAEENASGDLALIFTFMKVLDPGSVVKETEFANAQNAAGVPERIRNVWNKARSGERLNPEQRAEFLGTAYRMFLAAKAPAEKVLESYGGLAQDVGAKPERVVLPSQRVDVVPIDALPQGRGKAQAPTPSAKPQQLADVPELPRVPKGKTAADVMEEGKHYRTRGLSGTPYVVVKRGGKVVKVKDSQGR